jgi:hypothetical protein
MNVIICNLTRVCLLLHQQPLDANGIDTKRGRCQLDCWYLVARDCIDLLTSGSFVRVSRCQTL